MSQQVLDNVEATTEHGESVLGDSPIFEEVDLFATALIQGACGESPRAK